MAVFAHIPLLPQLPPAPGPNPGPNEDPCSGRDCSPLTALEPEPTFPNRFLAYPDTYFSIGLFFPTSNNAPLPKPYCGCHFVRDERSGIESVMALIGQGSAQFDRLESCPYIYRIAVDELH